MITGHFLENFINGPAHHTLHHLYFNVNYGQVSPFFLNFFHLSDSIYIYKYFTWADRTGGSYRQPDSSLDPMLEVKALKGE